MSAAMIADRVVIIGGGPVGMMLALNLAALGVKSTLINRETGPRWHPKGSTQNARTMEHYRRLGIVDAVRAVGLPRDLQTDVTYFTTLDGWELARLSMPSEGEKLAARAAAPADDQEVEPLYRCNQMHAEAVLFDQVQACALVDKRYGHECLSWREDTDGVTAEIENLSNGQRETIRGRYIAGCDGAHGIVRRQLGYSFRGEAPTHQPYLGGPMVSTYIRAADIPKVARTRCWQYWVVNTHIRANIVAVDGKSEFLFTTKLERPDQAPDEAVIAKAFRNSIGHDIAVEFVGHAAWTAGQFFVAEKFGAGRAWLAGDAVHLFTPTGGLGYNTAVEDAVNLGWKLAAVLKGWGGPALLKTYEIERQMIARRNTTYARGFADSVGLFALPAEIEQDTPAGEAARKVTGDHYNHHARFEFNIPGITFGGRYDGSPIIATDGTAPPPDSPNTYVPTGCPGGRAPHLWLDNGRSLYDTLGFEFTLLVLNQNVADAAKFRDAAQTQNIPLSIVAVATEGARDLYGADLALIRPDQIVAWRGNASADAATVLRQVIGHPNG